MIINAIGDIADTAVINYNEERENNPSTADKNLQSTGELFLTRIDTTGFFFYQLDLAKDKPSNKFESIEDMGSETSRKIPLIADKITKPRGQIQTFSSDNLNVNVGVLFRGKLYDNLTLLNTQAMVKLMLKEGKFNYNDFLIG